METSRQEPINFLVRSSGRGAAEVAAKQKRIRKNAVNLRIRSLLTLRAGVESVCKSQSEPR